MATIKELKEKYGKKGWGAHFKVRLTNWPNEQWFEPSVVDKHGANVVGLLDNGSIQTHPYTSPNWELVKPFKLYYSAIVAKDKSIITTNELFESEDEARRYCATNSFKYIKLDDRKVKVEEE